MKSLALLLLLVAVPAAAQEQDVAPNQRVTTFRERNPLSALRAQTERLGWDEKTLKRENADYDLSKETFRVYTPKRKGKRYGLLVWIAPGALGAIPPWWEKYLKRRGIIAVGANLSGNFRASTVRIGLALDAVHNLTAKHEIDPERIYVAGFSGGGNMACLLAFHYPELFRGGIYLAGCLYVRDVPVPNQPNRFWRGGINPPTPERLALVKKRTRHVYLSGARDDMALIQTKAILALTQEDGFKNVEFLEVPDLGHEITPPKWFDKCLRFVEKKPRKE